MPSGEQPPHHHAQATACHSNAAGETPFEAHTIIEESVDVRSTSAECRPGIQLGGGRLQRAGGVTSSERRRNELRIEASTNLGIILPLLPRGRVVMNWR